MKRSQRKLPQRCRGKRDGSRLGAAAVEFAVIAPIMILFMFGLVEIGRFLMIKNALTHASREGARFAVTPTATADAVRDRVLEEVNAYFDSGSARVVVTPEVLTSSQSGTTVGVRVEVDIAAISWIPGVFNTPSSILFGETTMRRESTN